MFVHTQSTPNPQTLKFVPGVPVLESGTMTFNKEDVAGISPLADLLFKIDGVISIFLTNEFITVTKQIDQDWEYLKPMVLASIVDHFVGGMPVLNLDKVNKDGPKVEPGSDIISQIIDLIETRVRPAVAEDGGDIIFKDFKDGIVYLELHGSCSGCPSSSITLKNGIENMLKHYIPQIESVEAV
jgi:Fe-S cluster biogenesis protein NfuA